MSRWEKRLARLYQNPKNVRFDEVEVILLRLGFVKRQDGTSHAIFKLEGVGTISVPKPHGTPFVKEAYIKYQLLPTLEAMGILGEEHK